MKKFIHALVLAVFGLGCFLVWGILHLAGTARVAHLPGFTTLCISLEPVLVILPVLAATYCLWVWFRKSDRVPSWLGFFATTMSALVLVTLPSLIAAYLPVLAAMNNFATR